MKPYPYQEKAVSNALNMIEERGNSLIVAGTGAGKTIMMAEFIKRYFSGFLATHGRNPHILVLVHRTEIHTQNHSKFHLVCPNIPTSEITAQKKSLTGFIHFGMVQTVVGLLPEFEKGNCFFDLIVIDEAHHAAASTYDDIINWNLKGKPDAALLGVTATPNRGDKLPLIHMFDNFYQITTKFLIDSHYLVRPTFKDLTPIFDLKDRVERGKLQKNCKNDLAGTSVLNGLIDDYLLNKEEGQTIIFAPSHEFCERIYKRLKELGRNPAYLGPGIDDATRKEELKKFEEGKSDELINVDICTEGYDYPPIRNLVDFDTNGSHGQWVQKVGRVLRTCHGKTSCTVIDFGGNIEMYPDGVETDVALEGAVKKEKGEKLTESDLFKKPREAKEERPTAELIYQQNEDYTPYNLPEGFETVNDKDMGIVFVACGSKNDCIIIGGNEGHNLFIGDKKEIKHCVFGSLDECIKAGLESIGEVIVNNAPISNIQIKLLAPEYPTAALTYSGANCHICWKLWKKDVTSYEH